MPGSFISYYQEPRLRVFADDLGESPQSIALPFIRVEPRDNAKQNSV